MTEGHLRNTNHDILKFFSDQRKYISSPILSSPVKTKGLGIQGEHFGQVVRPSGTETNPQESPMSFTGGSGNTLPRTQAVLKHAISDSLLSPASWPRAGGGNPMRQWPQTKPGLQGEGKAVLGVGEWIIHRKSLGLTHDQQWRSSSMPSQGRASLQADGPSCIRH